MNETPVIDDEAKLLCESPITVEECSKAISQMQNNKSLGHDGLPVKFYKSYFHTFGQAFVDMINSSIEAGNLPKSMSDGLISLICKNKNKPDILKNWRPISLLCVDYKISFGN